VLAQYGQLGGARYWGAGRRRDRLCTGSC